MENVDAQPLALNLKQAAQMLGVAENTVRALAQRGEIRARRAGSRWLISRRALERYLEGENDKPAGRGGDR